MKNRLNVLVTGTGSLVGQAIIKCIRKSEKYKNANIIGMDIFENTVGSYFCDSNVKAIDILKTSENNYKEYIIDILIKNNINYLFIGVDFELLFFAKNAMEIEKLTSCKIIVSSENVIKIANDKYITYSFLKEHNLFFPKTYSLYEENVLSNFDFPIILKPKVGARSRGLYKVSSNTEFNEIIANFKKNEYIIQECIGTDSDEYTCGAVLLDDNTIDIPIVILKRTLKEGNTYSAIYDDTDKNIKNIKKYILDILKILKPYGSCNFQLRVDKYGTPKLFEINARHSGTTYIRSLFGFNEIEYILDSLEGKAISSFTLKNGKVIRFFDEVLLGDKQ